jgi:hypothetical protein
MANLTSRYAIPCLPNLMQLSGIEATAAGLKRLQAERNRSYPSPTKIEHIIYRLDLMRFAMAQELIAALNHARTRAEQPHFVAEQYVVEFDSCIPRLGQVIAGFEQRRNDPEANPREAVAIRSGCSPAIIAAMCQTKNVLLVPRVIAVRVAAAAALECQIAVEHLTPERVEANIIGSIPVADEARKSVFQILRTELEANLRNAA